jgi:formamidopyrimidine-DNA glycosylase
MPELPEVETVARDLRGLIVGAAITRVRCNWPKTIGAPASSWAFDASAGREAVEAFERALVGRRITGVGRRAKEVLLELDGEPCALLSIHLRMTGQLFVEPAAMAETPEAPVDQHVHLVLSLDDGRELRFRDIRKFGRVHLHLLDADPFAGHGPEPLEPAFTAAAFEAMLRRHRGRIKPLLLDQAFLAGVGNIYADEALWLARIHPLRTASSLTHTEATRLHDAIVGTLREAVERRGSSVRDYTAPSGDGSMQEHLRVYQRTGDPCERCGRPVRRIVVAQRGTHLCTWCQRLPREARRAATPNAPKASKTASAGRTASKRLPRWTRLPGSERAVGSRRFTGGPAATTEAGA